MTRRLRTRRGMTLVEIVVVVLILGLALATVSPAALPRAVEPPSAVAEVAGILDAARREAVVQNRRHTVVVDADRAMAWRLGQERDSAIAFTAARANRQSVERRPAALARATFVFTPDGRALPSGLWLDGPKGPEWLSVRPDGRVVRGGAPR